MGRGGQCSGCQLGLIGEVVDPGGESCEGFFGGWCWGQGGRWCGGCFEMVEEEGGFKGGGELEESRVCSA